MILERIRAYGLVGENIDHVIESLICSYFLAHEVVSPNKANHLSNNSNT